MAQESDAKLCLAPHDPWVLKKKLTDYIFAILMDNIMVQNLESSNGIEVKLHIVEKGHEADDYTLTFTKKPKYFLKAG
ncbi:unnamed protein product [Eruca vesicaria subsp. sativa]|uniref:Uncharacterized protein n=1 Tax=Eruca vesicaria subsp. sativa TaxID=29727 RepID=A0ABC8K1L0_ERUVS|nr:unnamed protein product [Eruca vesicaria subsp. sativa]